MWEANIDRPPALLIMTLADEEPFVAIPVRTLARDEAAWLAEQDDRLTTSAARARWRGRPVAQAGMIAAVGPRDFHAPMRLEIFEGGACILRFDDDGR
jgi:hypothetical protein